MTLSPKPKCVIPCDFTEDVICKLTEDLSSSVKLQRIYRVVILCKFTEDVICKLTEDLSSSVKLHRIYSVVILCKFTEDFTEDDARKPKPYTQFLLVYSQPV